MSDANEEVVRCKRIEIVDDNLVTRAVIGTDRNPRAGWDNVSLVLFSPDGKEHVALYCESEVSGLEFWEHGNNVASVRTNRDGLASVDVADEATGQQVFGIVNDPTMPVRLGQPVPVSFGLSHLRFLRLTGHLSIKEV